MRCANIAITLLSVPNGASLRPNTRRQQEVVQGARGDSSYIYTIPAGTFINIYIYILQ